jgi:hypothetical protein
MSDEKNEPIVTVTRTLTYTGPLTWVKMCQARAFVQLDRELDNEGTKKISSEWGEIGKAEG